MATVKVLVVDDSAFMRKMITDMVNQDKQLTVIGTARNGLDGIEKIKKLKPDVVTMDVEMPEMDGISALKIIMEEFPVPVIMLSSLTKDGTRATIQAIENGAVDFISKPSGAISLDIAKVQQELVTKIKLAMTANISRKLIKQTSTTNNNDQLTEPTFIHKQTVVAIGVSTGGPRALQQILKDIPQDFPAPILIVQHMPKSFTKSLADRLNRLCSIEVSEAENGEILSPGRAYIAPGDFHMEIKKIGSALAIQLEQSPPKKGHRPSVDNLLQSLAHINNVNKVAVILTGMGSDGTEGAKYLRNKDKHTYIIAESQETAVIYGMPKSIIENVGANLVLPIDEIAEKLQWIMNR